ncbi:hypothetical protein FUAX_12160 [Fulvitalea axinellae]|uniref:Uncharacterized protein n=1 Tax=Fulvitalea axinellae TaxID=1182444 RepID=A0AAU9CQT7_9BACT|nr:hypothetical protein FUAX_12160 [Fulvitalea axinellae]
MRRHILFFVLFQCISWGLFFNAELFNNSNDTFGAKETSTSTQQGGQNQFLAPAVSGGEIAPETVRSMLAPYSNTLYYFEKHPSVIK